MRTLDSARSSWQELKRYQSLAELKEAVRLDGRSSIATEGCRSACWKAFLLFDTLDLSTWQNTLSSSRSAYNAVRAHCLRHLENPEDVEAGYDPLGEDTDASSPWTQARQDEELRAEIFQDVTRCMPENLYFRQPDTQRMLLDILFIFCKLNPDVSYRQGMHELLAPILWVVERDAIDLGQSSKVMGENAIIVNAFDPAYIEHDTFALFGQMMQSAKNFYEQSTTSGNENPIVVRSRRIFDDLLPKVDEDLAKHLQSIDIIPQVFLMRWIRLLFGREFAFDDMLTIWDVILAEDPTLDIVNEICLAMLLRIRWKLIEADYNEALALLLRYPELEKDFSAQTFALDAVYLREHTDYRGGSYLVSKYTDRPIYHNRRPTTPPAIQRRVTGVSGAPPTIVTSKDSASRAQGPARHIENLFQSTAKEIYTRSERLGIGKAVRIAVDEVQKRAQEIRDAPTPSPPRKSHQPRRSQSSLSPFALQDRVKTLEDRNKQLAKLLDGALNDLWVYQKRVAGDNKASAEENPDRPDVEDLNVAIAKVQFVQVYLDDAKLILPGETSQTSDIDQIGTERIKTQGARTEDPLADTTDTSSSLQEPVLGSKRQAETSDNPATTPTPYTSDLADPSTFEEEEDFPLSAVAKSTTTEIPEIVIQDDISIKKRSNPSRTTGAAAAPSQPSGSAQQKTSTSTSTPRPRLDQSPYSWMLGGEQGNKSATSSGFSQASSERRGGAKGFLFGGADFNESDNKTNSKPNSDHGTFDLGNLRHGKK